MSEPHRFVSWVRFGAGAARISSAPAFDVTARIDGTLVTQSIALLGPGDVVGLARGIVRRDPPPRALGATPVMFPLVELQPPDLPWRYSPMMPTSTGLVPWIALLVVPAAMPLASAHGAVGPVIDVAGDQLPRWSELSLWCHAQLTAPFDGRPLAEQIASRPTAALARLLCPRRLAPNERYRAVIVPTFEAGRRAGLGEAFTEVMVAAPAWGDDTATIRLPVYDSWEFGTGGVADFELLARKLRGLPASALSPMSIDLAQLGIPTSVDFFGVLRPPQASDAATPTAVAGAIASRLATSDEVVGPPVYGSGPAGRTHVAITDADWLAQLNLDPRWRLMASVGGEVVRLRQEELVAAAWDRAGAIRQANRVAGTAQLGSAARRGLVARAVASRSPDGLIALAAPALIGESIAHALRFERLAPSVRRAARPVASWMRDRTAGTRPLIQRATAAVPLTAQPRPAGMVTFATLRAASAPVSAPMPRRGIRVLASDIGRFTTRVAALRHVLANRAAIPTRTLHPSPALDATPLATAVAAEIQRRLDRPFAFSRIRLGDARSLGIVADLVAAPDLSRPLADDVAMLAPRLFAAGLVEVPTDRAIVLEIDPRAIEAIVAGANHELARELIWRGFPLDTRATLLSTFWDHRGAASPGEPRDVAPLHTWTRPLGENAIAAPTTVVVIRGELIRRFPEAIIGHVAAVADPATRRRPAADLVLPRFLGHVGDDTVYVGLPADLATLRAGLGSYIVIMERPGAARFGLDAVASAAIPERWDELAWDHAPLGAYLSSAAPVQPVSPGALAWARSAAHMAAITERPAVRLSIHLDELLREDTDGRA